jgi:hypothetical protein
LVDAPKLWVAIVAVAVEVAEVAVGLVAGPAELSTDYLQHLYHQDEDLDPSAQKH